MFNNIETIAIVIIILAQFFVAIRVYRQISVMNGFLPKGKKTLSLEEYVVPSDEILKLNPYDVIGQHKYKPTPKAETTSDSPVVPENHRTETPWIVNEDEV